jgi:hypothetical protein
MRRPRPSATWRWTKRSCWRSWGSRCSAPAPGFGPADLERAARFAREWLDRRQGELREYVCGSALPALERDGGFDTLADVAVVADSIQALLGRPTAFIVAVILVRRGLGRFCEGFG